MFLSIKIYLDKAILFVYPYGSSMLQSRDELQQPSKLKIFTAGPFTENGLYPLLYHQRPTQSGRSSI